MFSLSASGRGGRQRFDLVDDKGHEECG